VVDSSDEDEVKVISPAKPKNVWVYCLFFYLLTQSSFLVNVASLRTTKIQTHLPPLSRQRPQQVPRLQLVGDGAFTCMFWSVYILTLPSCKAVLSRLHRLCLKNQLLLPLCQLRLSLSRGLRLVCWRVPSISKLPDCLLTLTTLGTRRLLRLPLQQNPVLALQNWSFTSPRQSKMILSLLILSL
jgi:hypothetical protein